MRTVLWAVLFFLIVLAGRHEKAVLFLVKEDFLFASSASFYQGHFGLLLPSVSRGTPADIPASATPHARAGSAGIVVEKRKWFVRIQHGDGTESHIKGIDSPGLRLFSRVSKGEWLGTPVAERMVIQHRGKNGAMLSEEYVEND